MNPFLNLDPKNLIEVTKALISVESFSRKEDQLCDYLEEWVRQLRSDASVSRISNNLIVKLNQASDVKPAIFAGHIDTVPDAQFEGETNLIVKEQDGRIFGLGASDMKSGIALMIAILADIQISSTFIFYEAEEIAEEFNGLRKINEIEPEILQGKWAILFEPTNAKLEMGCQGAITVEAKFHGKRAHSARPWMGENAIQKSIKVLQRALKESESQVEVEVEGLTYTPTLQVTKISGGVAGNVIPDVCVVTINRRFAPDCTADQAQDYVVNQVCEDADEVEVSSISAGAYPAMDHELVSFAELKNIELVPKIGWTDVARFYALGIPAVNFGPGDPELCHRADESIEISKLGESYEILSEFLAGLEN